MSRASLTSTSTKAGNFPDADFTTGQSGADRRFPGKIRPYPGRTRVELEFLVTVVALDLKKAVLMAAHRGGTGRSQRAGGYPVALDNAAGQRAGGTRWRWITRRARGLEGYPVALDNAAHHEKRARTAVLTLGF